jgi:hypothetical protein
MKYRDAISAIGLGNADYRGTSLFGMNVVLSFSLSAHASSHRAHI